MKILSHRANNIVPNSIIPVQARAARLAFSVVPLKFEILISRSQSDLPIIADLDQSYLFET
jgi:hypothetical protein